jgi:hypothetical protein
MQTHRADTAQAIFALGKQYLLGSRFGQSLDCAFPRAHVQREGRLLACFGITRLGCTVAALRDRPCAVRGLEPFLQRRVAWRVVTFLRLVFFFHLFSPLR